MNSCIFERVREPLPFFIPIFFLLALLGAVVPASAQNIADSFVPYMNSAELRDLAVDAEGTFWIASNGGALRFNPSTEEWTKFPKLQGTGPRGNDLVTISVDGLGRVWTGGPERGFTFYDIQLGAWDRNADEWPDPNIRVIRSFGNAVYIGTQNGLSLKPTPGRTDICADADPSCIVPSFFVNDYALLGDTLWVATQGGLGRFNGTTWDSVQALPPRSAGQASKSLAVLNGVLWEATADSVRRLVGGTWESDPFTFNRIVESGGELFGLAGRNLYRWNGTTWPLLSVGLGATEDIRDVQAFGGLVYLATKDGLVAWREVDAAIVDRFFPPGIPLSGSYSGISVATNGDVWVGTSQQNIGIMRFNGESWSALTPAGGGLNPEWILDVFVDREDNVWIGHCCCPNPPLCFTQALSLGEFLDFPDVVKVQGFDEDSFGRIWTASEFFGVEVLEKQGGVWGSILSLTSFSTTGAMASDDVQAVAVSGDGTYIGHNTAGLDYWPHNGNLGVGSDGSNWIGVEEGGLGLLDGAVGAIEIWEGDAWVGTAVGLHRFRNGSLQERCPTRRLDVSGDLTRQITAMVVDRLGGLWIGTTGGILYLPRGGACTGSGGAFRLFTEADSPLPSNTIMTGALSPADGSVWFGTPEGILRIDPLVFTGTEPPPDRFVLFPNPLDLSSGSPPQARRVFLGIEVGGLRVIRASSEDIERPEIFDLAGRKVGEFDIVNAPSGTEWFWDGINKNGNFVAPGLYIVQARTSTGELFREKVGVIR